MKNLKKVLALVVALTMVLGTVAFAFTDVDVEHDAYTAITTLSSLNILNGYEDGTFGPEKDITRAEFAAVVCRALNLEGSVNGSKGATQFTDVPADHWATGYINLAAGQNIINGMGDGTFEPESNVTYEQAVKMLVVALGFEPMAAQKGGWPTGYIVVANTYGMADGVKVAADSAAANRGVVAQLVYNALDIPMMIQTGFGTNTEYTIQDGNNDRDYVTLLTNMEVAKLGGVVTKTSVIGEMPAGEVEYTINDCFDNTEWEDITYKYGDAQTFDIGEGVYVDEYFGIASEIFAREVRNGWEIIAIMQGEDSEIVELDLGDIDLAATEATIPDKKTDYGFIKYYVDENAKKTTNLKLDTQSGENPGMTVYFNNVATTLKDLLAKTNEDIEIQVINNDTDSAYDMIIAKEYTYGIIDRVEADRDRITVKGLVGGSRNFTFDFEDEEVINNIINKDGEEIALADFAEGDVVAYISEGNDNKDFAWIEMINLGENAVTGIVGETNSEAVFIDNVEYEIAAGVTFPKVNEEGTFYLTKTNKIFSFDLDASVSSNYAYVLEMGQSTSAFSSGWQIKLLTKEGSIVIYDTKDKFKVSGVEEQVDSKTANYNNLGFLANLMTDNDTNKAFNTELANRLVTYKLDGNDKIKEINKVAVTSLIDANGVTFNANSSAISGKVLEDDVVVFDISAADMDDAKVMSLSNLVDESEYKGLLGQNADKEWDVFVVTEGLGAIDLEQDFAIIESINDVTINDNEAIKVKFYTAADAELKEITIEEDINLDWGTKDDLVKGAIFMYTADENGVASNVGVIAVPVNDNKPASDAYKIIEAADKAFKKTNDDIELVTGYIYEVTSNGTRTNIAYNTKDGENAEYLTIKGAVNGYTYNNRNINRVKIEVDDWMGTDVETTYQNDGVASFFIAKADNGVATDIVSYSTMRNIK